jgi:hypothetical protein
VMQLHWCTTFWSARIQGTRSWPACAAPAMRAKPNRRALTRTVPRLCALPRRCSPAWQIINDVDGPALDVGAHLLSRPSTAGRVATYLGNLRRLGDEAALHGIGGWHRWAARPMAGQLWVEQRVSGGDELAHARPSGRAGGACTRARRAEPIRGIGRPPASDVGFSYICTVLLWGAMFARLPYVVRVW